MTPRTLREELRRTNREQLTAIAENWGISDPAGTLTGSEIRDLIVPRILNSDSLREKLAQAPAGTDLALRVDRGGRAVLSGEVCRDVWFGARDGIGPLSSRRALAQSGIGQRMDDLSWVHLPRVRRRRFRAGCVLCDAGGSGPVFRRAGAPEAGPGSEAGCSACL